MTKPKPGYINATFRSSVNNEAYFFINDKYVLLNYAPGTETIDDKILDGPIAVRDGFKSLTDTIFGTYGIDSAFNTDNNEAYIFYQNYCALIDYAPNTDENKIIIGATKITDMFPFLKESVFQNGVDCAYRSTLGKEAYLFRGDKYARIDYSEKRHVQVIRKISDGFVCFRGTIFENGIDAVFQSHQSNEAYFFKDEYYARVQVTPGQSHDTIMDGVRTISDNWKALGSIIPLN